MQDTGASGIYAGNQAYVYRVIDPFRVQDIHHDSDRDIALAVTDIPVADVHKGDNVVVGYIAPGFHFLKFARYDKLRIQGHHSEYLVEQPLLAVCIAVASGSEKYPEC